MSKRDDDDLNVDDVDDDLPSDDFTPQERRAIRRVLRDEDRARFMWRTIRRFSGWAFGAVAAIWTGWNHIVSAFHALQRALAGG